MRDVVVTRVEFSGPPRASRNLAEHLMVRFPGAYRRASAFVQRLRPGSRLRSALLRQQIVSGWAAVNRRDLELMFVRYAPDVVYEFHTGVEVLGISGTVRGQHAVREAFDKIREGLTWEVEPQVMLDLGERFLLLGRLRVSGPESQIELDGGFAQLLTVGGGLITREQDFRSWDEGLNAAGLDRNAIALPHVDVRE